MQDRCTNCMERTICFEIYLEAPNRTPRCRVSYRISLRSLWRQCQFRGARQVHGLCLMHYRLRNYFGRTRWYSLVNRLEWNLGSVCLEIVLILMQDRCTIRMKTERKYPKPNRTVFYIGSDRIRIFLFDLPFSFSYFRCFVF